MSRLLGALALAGAMVGCSGDDADDTSTATTAAPTMSSTPATESPPTTAAPTTTAVPTTPAPPTTPSPEALQAQIAADYVRAAELRDELTRNPTLDGLEDKAARISAPGSPDYESLVTFIEELVERGERIAPGVPDLNTTTVERVELSADSPDVATVTVCEVFNDRRVGPTGEDVSDDTGILSAIRIRRQVQRTAHGWLPASPFEPLSAAEEVTTCPAP